jgi:3-oxoadipate enol-lactonase
VPLIDVPGGKVDVISTGEGPDLVLLHSLLIDRSAFEGVVPALLTARRVHRIALPGFDESTPVEGGVEAYADRIADALVALRLERRAAVLGNGFGGFIALALAARHGALFERLVLVGAAAAFPEPAKAAFRIMAEKVTTLGMGAIAGIAAGRIFHDAYLAAHPAAIDERRAVLERFDPAAFAAACRALERVDLRPALGSIRNPTLFVVGELDQATPKALGEEVARAIPGARFVVLPRCGHCPPLEQPELFLATVRDFLALT